MVLMAVLAGTAAVHQAASWYYDKTPRNTSKPTGLDWVNELNQGHHTCFYDNLGMNQHVFHALIQALISKAQLGDTKHVTLEEQLAGQEQRCFVRLQAFLLFFYSLPKLPSTATRLCLVSGPLEGPLAHIYMVYTIVPESNPS